MARKHMAQLLIINRMDFGGDRIDDSHTPQSVYGKRQALTPEIN